ncbi:hypothetical protein M877_36265 [Streptomyces niveus NCIMB 11891]|nr:hypothetical protein M877_36265 [Streptomyces niveus NCIMB 11891]
MKSALSTWKPSDRPPDPTQPEPPAQLRRI